MRMLVTRMRLMVVILVVGTLVLVQMQAQWVVPASTPLSGSSSEEKEVQVQVTEPVNVTVEWTSVDPAWGRKGDMAHYITTTTEPMIAVRALRDVSSLEFSVRVTCTTSVLWPRAGQRRGCAAHSRLHARLPWPRTTTKAPLCTATESPFLHYWAELLQRYPNLKLWVRNTKDYKKLTAALYGIGSERVITGQLPLPNLSLFPPLQRENTNRMDFMLFITLVDKHFARLRAAAGPFKREEIPILIMPRQNKENYVENDRKVPGYDVLGQWATRIGGKVLNADEVKSMGEQASVVLASKVIVLDYGSSLFFNGVTARNSTILVIGNLHHHECPHGLNCALGHAHLFLKIISNGNRVHFIPPGDVQAIRNIVPSLPT